MPALDHWAKSAGLTTGQVDPSVLRGAFYDRVPYAVKTTEDPRDLVVTDPVTGAIVRVLFYAGKAFYYDPLDTTSVDDGVSVLVIGGKRYKTDGTPTVPRYVLAQQNAPPGSPSIGDAYLIDTAPTGAWAAHAKNIAVYTVRGWEYIAPGIGMIVYISGTDLWFRYNASAAWVQGFGISAIGAASILPSHLAHANKFGVAAVENQTTNAPPAVTNGVAYIIGVAPTGAWAGHAGKIAHGENSAWVIYTPAEGWIAYDKATKAPLAYQSGAWTSLFGAIINASKQFTATGSTTTGGASTYTYSSGTAPTSSLLYVEDSVTLVYTARKTAARLRFTYNLGGFLTSGTFVAALFRDADANAIDWTNKAVSDSGSCLFVFDNVTSPDASSHTYKVRFINTGSGVPTALTRRTFAVEEFV